MKKKPELNREPVTIDKLTWFYEERKGINLVHEERAQDGAYIRTVQIILPYGKVKRAMARITAVRNGR